MALERQTMDRRRCLLHDEACREGLDELTEEEGEGRTEEGEEGG